MSAFENEHYGTITVERAAEVASNSIEATVLGYVALQLDGFEEL